MNAMREIFENMGIADAAGKEKKLDLYMSGILDRNKQINLTAITDEREFVQKHYVDSLSCCRLSEFEEAQSIIDIGTGGGFPGVPLAVAFPEKEFVLLDSLNKRIKIVQELCEQIGIHNVRPIHGRAEDLARRSDMREVFDLCVSRAVANMSTLAEYCLPFVKVGGAFIAYKGTDWQEELQEAQYAIKLLGGGNTRVENDEERRPAPAVYLHLEHRLIVTNKIKETPTKYPRKAGKPSKSPLKHNNK